MAGFIEHNNELTVDGVSLKEIADTVGTPTYVYSAAHIRGQYEALQGAMARALPADRQPLLCYACKANSHLSILSLLRTLGSGLEIVSEGELIRGLKSGFSADHIISTGVGKTTREIKALLQAGIYQINVESLEELHRINDIATSLNKTANIVFRLNPNVSGGGHDKISTGRKSDKFGISEDQVFQGFSLAQNMPHVNALGLSVHIGSQVFDVSAFKTAFSKLPGIVHELRAQGYTVSRLDIGGGFPIQYNNENLLDLDAYAQWVRDIILPLDTDIAMEPGRYLVGNAGILLTHAEYIKKTDDRTFLIMDAAMNDLIRPAMYEAFHNIEPVQNRNRSIQTYDVVGPVCESSDRFILGHQIPAIEQGDLLAIRSAGAYGYCMSSNYNTRPRPAEVLVDNGTYHVITARETYDDLLSRDVSM